MFRIIHPNRWFFWTISLLIIIGLILLYSIESTTRELEERSFELVSVASWKTFRSQAFGISVRYPPSWQIEVDREESNTVHLQNPINFSENITISVVAPKLEKVIRQALKIASEEEITVDATRGVWIRGIEARDQATQNVVLINRGEKFYYIAGQAAAFEKIVTGIKFLEE